MRKLSKKISMLMVLAMLVSLFSGVVSASAASVWSFYNKTADDSIVAYAKETYKMENDQFADFDLYKSDEIVDTDVYTVVYESSDEEVVWVNAKNGKLRAQKDAEIGATAEITAHITNKVTGAEADRSFTIEIVEAEVEEPVEVEYAITPNFGEEAFIVGTEYELKAEVTDAEGEAVDAKVVFTIDDKEVAKYTPAEAGEVTIIATVSVDDEEVGSVEYICAVVKAELLDVVQKDARTVELTFDVAISAAEAEKIELWQKDVNKNVYKKNVAVKDNVVTFTSYKDFADKTEWIFKYGEDEVKLTASLGAVDYVVIEGPAKIYTNPVDASKKTVDIKLSYYDKNGVKVAAPANAWIDWKVDTKLAVIGGNKITAVKANEFVEISGVFHSNDYKLGENGQYTEYTCDIAPYEIQILESDAANIKGVKEAKVGTAENAQIATLPANRYNYKLFVVFNMDDGTTKKASELSGISYETTDESKLIVDPKTGALIPLAANTAVKVIVNATINKEVTPVGAVDVVIGANVTANDPAYTAYKSVSNSTNLEGQTAEFKFEGKDNYGATVNYSVKNGKAGIKALSTPDGNSDAVLAAAMTTVSTNANVITVAAKGMKTGTYVYEAEIQNDTGDNKTWKRTFSVYVEDGNSDLVVKDVKLIATKTEYDTTITKDTTAAAITGSAITYKIVGYNAKGVAVEEIVSGCTVTVKLNNNPVTNLNLYQAATGGSIVVDGVAYKAIENGNYLFEGYWQKDADTQLKFTPVNVNVKGGQTAPAISFEKNDAKVSKAIAFSSLATQLDDCFKAPDTTNNNDYKYENIAVANADIKTTIVDGCDAGTYVAHVANVTVEQRFVKSGIVITYKVPVAKNVTVTVE